LFSFNLENENMLSKSAKTFDEQPCTGSSIGDIWGEAFLIGYLPKAIDEETLAANSRSFIDKLASLGFFDPVRAVCTNAGILMFGKDPQRFIRGSYINFGIKNAQRILQENGNPVASFYFGYHTKFMVTVPINQAW
jgi:predicted HTH transcriptional regulator